MRFGLDEKTIEKIISKFKKFGEIKLVIIYGSRAKGNYRAGSDIDLSIKNSNLSLEKFNQLKSELDDLNTPYTFDICIFEDLKTDTLIDHINRVGVEFYRFNENSK